MKNIKKVYIAGDMLNRGAQLLRTEERNVVSDLGHQFYNPMDNKEINDKGNAVQEALAERIVRHDTEAMLWSDTVIIEPSNNACGTMAELGQLLGMKDVAGIILRILQDNPRESVEDLQETLQEIEEFCLKQYERKVYPHMEDVRLAGPTGDGFRSTFGINAYITGACIKLADNPDEAPDGFYQWDAIVDKLSK